MFVLFGWLSIFWLTAMVVLLIIEALTANMVTIWFAAGSLAALIVSLFNGNFGVQLIVFAVVSAIVLALTKPIVAKLRNNTPTVPTNGDRNLGREATVIEVIRPGQPGRARIEGVDWTARSVTAAPLPVGTLCRVVGIESTTLILEPIAVPNYAQSV